MKKIVFDANGKLTARYDSEIHGDNIPAEAVEVSDEVFFATINEQDGDWRLVDGEIVKLDFPPEDPAIVKARVWEFIKAKRDAIKKAGIKVGNKWYHSDADSRIQHLGLKDRARDLLAASGNLTDRLKVAGQDIRWKTMDGSLIYITAQMAIDIVDAVGILDALAHTQAEIHKAQMEASEDPSSYDFSAGWPAVYEG
jgi:hypothetical protein